MITKLRQLYLKVFLGVSIMATGNTFASGDSKIGDINVTATGGAKAIGHANHVTTDSLTQNQGGRGGDNHITVNTTPLSPTFPDSSRLFLEGENCLKRRPPSWEEAMRVFRYAADQGTPHFNSCVRCAEYFWSVCTPPDVKQAAAYYQRALTSPNNDENLVYSGYMRMYYSLGVKATHKKMKQDFIQRAQENAGKITNLDEDDYAILDELAKINDGSSIDQVTNMFSSAAISPSSSIVRKSKTDIPEIATGYEDIYERIRNGKLIYRPNLGSDRRKIELRIISAINPLDCSFDLSQCGNASRYLRISSGYRKEIENDNKMEIWILPRFITERENVLHIKNVMGKWSEDVPIGIFWTWSGWKMSVLDFLTTHRPEDISSLNLYELWNKSEGLAAERVPAFGCRSVFWAEKPFSRDHEEIIKKFTIEF